jgi:hypothetical protein
MNFSAGSVGAINNYKLLNYVQKHNIVTLWFFAVTQVRCWALALHNNFWRWLSLTAMRGVRLLHCVPWRYTARVLTCFFRMRSYYVLVLLAVNNFNSCNPGYRAELTKVCACVKN